MVMVSPRDDYQAFHTNSKALVNYMVERLDARPGNRVLEPAAGTGLLIDATLARYVDIKVDGYEIQRELSNDLALRFDGDSRFQVFTGDFVEAKIGTYDRVIANPPYGAWLDHDRRDSLQRKYPGLYVRETYTLFMYRTLQVLRTGGRAVFIVPETFLYLHRHEFLRHALLTSARIIDLAIFPSRFFPGIGMGYAKLCIITFEREQDETKCRANEFCARLGFRRPEDLSGGSSDSSVTTTQEAILASVGSALLLSDVQEAVSLINTATVRIGDVAACVTGFYSGNDRRFLRNADSTARNSMRYERIDPSRIAEQTPCESEAIEGIVGSRHYVPVRKGGPDRFVSPVRWYMDWSQGALSEYRASRKARLQNTQFYFRRGIGVPMVSGKGIRACLLNGELFDQAIVGVFPRNAEDELLLLGFLNSPTATALIRTINPTANNSANYLKKVPFLLPSTVLRRRVEYSVGTIVDEMEKGNTLPEQRKIEIDEIFREVYGF